jgi:hypothetical protein
MWMNLFQFLWHWFVLLIGGWIVIAGLLLEDIPDWYWFRWPKDDPRRHKIGRIAIYVIVLGILIESIQTVILDVEAANARLETVKLEQQIAQTSNNVVKIDPLNQPIMSATAEAEIEIRGNVKERNSPEIQNMPDAPVAEYKKIMSLSLFVVQSGSNSSGRFLMMGDKPLRTAGKDSTAYNIAFHESMIFPVAETSPRIPNAGSLENIDVVFISAFFLPGDTEIVKGSVVVTINSTVSRRYTIPPQKVSWPEYITAVSEPTRTK